MRGIRELLLVCTIVASVAIPLGLPAVALADTVAVGPVVAITGTVESLPAGGVAGEWVVDGAAFQAGERTRLMEAAGPAGVGAQVAVLAWQGSDGSAQAYMIRVQSAAQTAWMQSLMARVRNALRLTTRLRLRTQSQQQLQTQTQTQTQTRTQLQTQTQTQARQQDQTQTQTRQQNQTQTRQQSQDGAQQQDQTQTQTRQQDRTQTQQQSQDCTQQGTGAQTRSMLGH